MNSTDSLTTTRPSLPSVKGGGEWTMPANAWIFIAVFVSILALLAVVAIVKYLMGRNSRTRSTVLGSFQHSKVTPRDSFEKRVISAPTSIPTPQPSTTTTPVHSMSPPQVIITPPTPNPGEEERTKKRAYSLEDY